jgi:hypothetical protein
MGQGKHPINFLETYFDIPEKMTDVLNDDLKNTKEDDINNFDSKLSKLNALKDKLRNCLTPELGDDVDTSMPEGISNKYGHIFFITLVSRTLPDKEAHKHIIRDCIIFELDITLSNLMESFQRDLVCHLKQYKMMQGTKWKNIVTCIIKQYRKIDKPAFQTSLNTRILTGSMKQTNYTWLTTLIRWTNDTRQDLRSRNLYPKLEVADNHEINTVHMHQNTWTSHKAKQ